MDRKPVIGVTPYRRKTEPFDLYVPEGIVKAVERLGGEVFLIDYDNIRLYELIGMIVQLDGVIFAGGVDVAPFYFGQDKSPACGEIDEKRDRVELNMFPLLRTRGIPILGICRGCQVINVAFGGTLIQDIPEKFGFSHRQDDANGKFFHDIDIKEGTNLYKIMGEKTLLTNSYHHQAVDELGEGLIANAWSKDGLIEGIEASEPGQFVLGVQWHPESTIDDDEHSMKVFGAFMDEVNFLMSIPCHHHD
ncbi:MAG: gamma-glutamyl-gamma-aminobutyrate hydrolase family protein [Clostridia bacterium]|nr:gamma-glutamyl-gamma-aminobutyrate hydrolase family protein [Clostridia bacterium]